MSFDSGHESLDSYGNADQESERTSKSLSASEKCYSTKNTPKVFVPDQGSDAHHRFVKISNKTPPSQTISELSYKIREDVKEALNVQKESLLDWRGVADKFKLNQKIIKKIEKEDDPTEKLLDELSHKNTKEFLQILYQLKRNDVLNIFYEELCNNNYAELNEDLSADDKRAHYQGLRFPSEESTPNSTNSDLSSSPFHNPKDDGMLPSGAKHLDPEVGTNGRTKDRKTSPAKQHTDLSTLTERLSTVNFHSEESRDFWNKIPPQSKSKMKEWREMEAHLKRDFAEECAQSQVLRFICYVLKIDPFEERDRKYVHDQDFANLIAWFGPVKSGEDGLFAKIAKLAKESIELRENGPHSFFAGYMSKDKADEIINKQTEVGTFLIRFSSTNARTGSFVVCLKTKCNIEHIELKGNPKTGKVTFNGEEYDDIVLLWKRYLSKEGVSQDGRTSCTIVCPDLPLNAMFKAYGAGPGASVRGRGRGRGRGARRGQLNQ